MALNEWFGDSQAYQQDTRYTVGGTAHAGDVCALARNGKGVSYTVVGGDTLATIAAALAALWVAATFPEATEAECQYTAGNAYLDLVATVAGRPFTVTAAVTGGGATTTLTASTIQASKGPNHVDDAANWSLGTTPGAGDDVLVRRGAAMFYGLGSFTVNSWEFRASYTQPVGLPVTNSGGYREDRTRFLTINGATNQIGTGEGIGSSQMFIKVVAASTTRIEKTGNRTDDATPALVIEATGNPTAIAISGGSDVGYMIEETTTARTAAAVSLTGDEAKLTIGPKGTVTALDMDKGAADVFGTVTGATVGRGNYTQHDGTLTLITAYGGYIRLNHEGTTTIVGKGRAPGDYAPQFDCEANNRPRTFDNSTFTGGAVLYDENKSVTLTPGGTHVADSSFFATSRLGPFVTWNRA